MATKTTAEFLSYLRSQEVKLWIEGEKLRCRVPEEAATPDLRAELVQRKEEIIAFLRRFGDATGDSRTPIVPVPRHGEMPLSFAQQRMWFADQWEPGNPAFNISTALRLTGPLDIVALEQCFNRVIERHEVLRTRFVAVDGRPQQVVAPALKLSLPVVDLSLMPETEREAEARRLAAVDARWSFDLARGPLVRAAVLRLSSEEHVLLLNMHHIVSDGWSSEVLVSEMEALYLGEVTGEEVPLPELPIQYCDFAVWQREWMQGEVLERQLAYWKEQLGDAPRVLDLPIDRPRPPIRSFRGARESFQLSEDVTRRLKALCQEQGTTMFMTLLAAFTVLLYRHTGQEDILVGSPIANRNRAEIEGLIGFFVNTLVLRTRLSGNPSLRELMAQVRTVTLGAYAHQDLPYEMLVDELHVERDLSTTPLFQVMMVLQNAQRPLHMESGPSFSLLDIDSEAARIELALSITETEQGLWGTLVYRTDLFERSTILRLVEHFQIVIEELIADPDQGVADVRVLGEAEQHQLLVEWNQTGTGDPQARRVHELVESQAEERPDAVAVVHEDQHLTYGELSRRARTVAHHLVELGIGPEDLVAILMERSAEMIVSQLAVMKAGGAFVPLEPSYPQDRLAFMVDDTAASVILTTAAMRQHVPQTQARVACVDEIAGASAPGSIAISAEPINPERLAYLIYTSGSTGRPKGVMCRHGGLTSLVEWHRSTFGIKPLDRATQLASVGFDASLREIWPYMVAGATLCIVSDEAREDPDELHRFIGDNGITVAFMPTPLAEIFIRTAPRSGLPLRCLFSGGDKLSTYADPDWGFELVNVYGPTENAVASTSARAVRAPGGSGPPPIGRPRQGVHAYVVDNRLTPVPIGVPGELCLGGDSLARGYLNRPDLTSKSFIPNPFSKDPGARLYLTGDLVRYLPDGNIEFLGRLDHQVKVRGFRIELGEVEAVLGQHPDVLETVVLARDETSGGKRLVAYLVLEEGKDPAVGELRQFLLGMLPDYMVPSTFVRLEALPLTSSGKVDRRALPAPDRQRPELDSEPVAPRTPTEEVLARIWAELLGLEQVGIHDNFFELGGHSLLATQVVTRIQDMLNVPIPLRVFFEMPTIAGLAAGADTLVWAAQVAQAGSSTNGVGEEEDEEEEGVV